MLHINPSDVNYILFSCGKWNMPDVLVSSQDLEWVSEHTYRWGSPLWALSYIANRPYVDPTAEPIAELITRNQRVYGDREWGYEYGMNNHYRHVEYY